MGKKPLQGVISAIGAYGLWGFLPIYWKLIDQLSPVEILAHRFIWSLIFMLVILLVTQRYRLFFAEMHNIVFISRKFFGVIAAALLIAANWFIYIWAVNDSRIVETSLGYYINPLVNVLLGVVFLREKLSFWQIVSVLLAFLGVMNMTVHFGSVPWVALTLAITFGLYGLCKKLLNIGAITSITLETMLISPVAFMYLTYLWQQNIGALHTAGPGVIALLIGAGVVTATPLLLFSHSANLLPLTVLGFIQYLSPTIALLVGVFLYQEPFSLTHFVSFSLIWAALIIFSLSQTKIFLQMESLVRKMVG